MGIGNIFCKLNQTPKPINYKTRYKNIPVTQIVELNFRYFAVCELFRLGRANVIKEINRDELEKYICGIISNKKCKPLAIWCNPDHAHVLIGLHPTISVSDLTGDIKSSSSKFINGKNWVKGRFAWQDGFGSFTYSKSQIDGVIKYILNQPIHHKKRTFKEEYLDILQKNDIEFDERYLFEWYD